MSPRDDIPSSVFRLLEFLADKPSVRLSDIMEAGLADVLWVALPLEPCLVEVEKSALWRLQAAVEHPCYRKLPDSFNPEAEAVGMLDDSFNPALWLSKEGRKRLDFHRLEQAGADQRTRPRKARRRASPRKPAPLTPEQTEAMQLVGEHKGNIAAAARAAGKSRAAMGKLYKKASKKLGKKATKHFTQRLPKDNRGQETIAAAEEE